MRSLLLLALPLFISISAVLLFVAMDRPLRAGVNESKLAPGGAWTAEASADLTLVHPSGARRTLGPRGEQYGSLDWSPDGQRLVTVSGKSKVRVFDAASGRMVWEWCCTSVYGDVRWAPGGDRIVVAGHWPAVLDARTGTLLRRFTREREIFANGAAAFYGWDVVAIGNQAGLVRVWRLSTGELLAKKTVGRAYIELMAVHRRSPVMAVAARNGHAFLWDFERNEVNPMPGPQKVRAMRYSTDGRELSVTGANGEFKLFTAAQERQRY